MERDAISRLPDLLAATETVRNQKRVFGRLARRRKQHQLAHLHRGVVMIALKPERARHSATARIQHVDVDLHLLQQLFFRGHFDERFLVAMTMPERFSLQLRNLEMRRVFVQEFRQNKSLFLQPFRVLVIRQKIDQLVFKNSVAARLQHDHGRAGGDVRLQSREHLF